jgi:N-glycosylase/DNA lyase
MAARSKLDKIDIERLKREYEKRRFEIKKRLEEFQEVRDRGDRAIFKELCFCILAANSSAEMGMRTVAALEDLLFHGDLPSLQRRVSKGFRYWRIRPAYIVHTRDYLQREFNFKLTALLSAFPDPKTRRDFFATEKNIKGLSFKESSHFLRNIGYGGYAIIDKHILGCLKELGVIRKTAPPIRRARYLEIEKKMKQFSMSIGIGMDELDLLLWSLKTGKILK